MNTNEVLAICKQLALEGKQPSVALVKTRMTGPKVLPLIIEGIKQYSANPNIALEKHETHVESELTDKLRIMQLERDAMELKKQVEELKVIIKKLTS
ncbi:hypothetical protein [Psychrosphaera haliotis]|uniref:KfrA N-terminal DNA-binding domain-containing protein n=1 Tax=Psychrosphaera haliotis TaxID=555083 RepID=A0A6N8F6S9_9GAMM|nr:hypothetical protein [Psychrosphaera haliotis]MUH71918.1 hypothetical protein [Psychrosphaera haliotis]